MALNETQKTKLRAICLAKMEALVEDIADADFYDTYWSEDFFVRMADAVMAVLLAGEETYNATRGYVESELNTS